MKSILILGGTGLVGSNLALHYLNNSDLNVTILARDFSKIQSIYKEYIGKGNFDFLVQDVTKPISSDKVFNIIVNAASSIDKYSIESHPVDIIKTNVYGTINCLDYLLNQKENKHDSGLFILTSSINVYKNDYSGNSIKEDETESTYSIDSIISAYSESKRLSEVIALSYFREFNLRVIITRLSSVYGYSKFPPSTAFFNFVKCFLSRNDIFIKDTVSPLRDNIYIEDVISAINILISKGVPGEAYNISSNGEKDNLASIIDIARAITLISKHIGESEIKLNLPDSIMHPEKFISSIILDNKKIRSLGWNLEFPLDEGIRKTLSLFLRDKIGSS